MYIWLINPLTMIKHFQWHTNGLSFLLSILTIIHNPYHPFLRDQSFWLPHVMSQTWKIMELAHTFAAFPVTLIISLEDTELLAPAKCERTASFVRRRIDVVSEKWRKWGKWMKTEWNVQEHVKFEPFVCSISWNPSICWAADRSGWNRYFHPIHLSQANQHGTHWAFHLLSNLWVSPFPARVDGR